MIQVPTEILIATSNEGKTVEIRLALQGLPFTIRTLNDFPQVRNVSESGLTYKENAIAKAVGYALQSGRLTLGEDSGLEVNALDVQPGVHSARFGGSGLSTAERKQILLSSLANLGNNARAARFVSVVVLAQPLERNPNVARILAVTKGMCEGAIAFTSRGEYGFGYDSIFIPNGRNQTFGELPESIKNQISHRAQSMMKMLSILKHLLKQT
jgi:non-canonical purine NTP pyrophosphatase (RdgB/HAM1 family)